MAEQLPVKFEFRANQTFDDYFSGSNLEIVEQLQKTVSGTGEQFVFLWGESGHGKSHLLHACCHAAAKLNLSSFYLDCADSTATNPDVLIGLESFHLICLDNIDNLIDRADWELALFNFFNQHRDQHHQLIVSSSIPPHLLAFTLPDLKTRLSWGLPLKLQTLDDKDKVSVLMFKANRMGFEITPQTAQFLLTRYDRSLTSLWLMLEKLDKASLAAQRKLTIPFLKDVLANPDR